jgi:hypothetical protein
MPRKIRDLERAGFANRGGTEECLEIIKQDGNALPPPTAGKGGFGRVFDFNKIAGQ